MKNKFLTSLFFILSFLAITSCQKAEDSFTTHQCYFSFNTSYHNTSRLLDVVNSYDPYAFVYTEPLSGNTYRVVTDIYGTDATRDNITTDAETQRTRIMGLANGLIIGRSVMDQTLYAFDRQCRNCFDNTGMTAAPLQWGANNVTVKCNKCGCEYNLSNGGVPSNGKGSNALFRYRITFDGTYIFVQNR